MISRSLTIAVKSSHMDRYLLDQKVQFHACVYFLKTLEANKYLLSPIPIVHQQNVCKGELLKFTVMTRWI